MVQVFLNQEQYIPGDELRIAVTLSHKEPIQLVSVRCFGYCRLPANVSRDFPDRSMFAFREKPGAPSVPEDSILLWATPNFPVHIEFFREPDGLVKLFIPNFLPPSLRGGLFEICHYAEISILIKGEFEMRTKRIPLLISGVDGMPKCLSPTIGDGFEQFDFNVSPGHQSTPHGRRTSAWEAIDLVKHRVTRRSASGFFRSRRTFKISFNNQHAVEISIHGEWVGDQLAIQDGSSVTAAFRFDHSNVTVQRICTRLVRRETIKSREEQWLHSTIAHTIPMKIESCLVEAAQTISIPHQISPSFQTELVGVGYQIDFELKAIDAVTNTSLETVIWTLPVIVQSTEPESTSVTPIPFLPFSEENEKPFVSLREAEIFQVRQRSHMNPGCMRYTIYS